MMLSLTAMYAPGVPVDIFATHGIPALIGASFLIGSVIAVKITNERRVVLGGIAIAIGILSFLVILFNLLSLLFANQHNNAVTAQQATVTEQTTELKEISTDIEEQYGFTPTDDLILTLLGEVPATQYETGKGEGLIWRGEPAEYLIDNTVYVLQLAWAGDKWLILDVTEGESIQLNELDLTQETDQ